MQACLCVHDHQEQIGLGDCFHHLPANLQIHRHARVVSNAACVDEPEFLAVPFGHGEVAIASRSRFVADDRALIADDAVEQSRFSDVRASDDRDDRSAETAHAATASASDAKKSIKSYEGKTGIGSEVRSSSKAMSSRKMRSSLSVSAGINAIVRSWRSASTRRMSAPTRRPAVVMVGPNNELSATISSNSAPVASCSASSSGGISAAIAFPVTTAMRLPSILGKSSSPSATRDRSDATEPIPFSICEKSP